MRYQVTYTVPVIVTVDTAANTVERVIIDGDQIQLADMPDVIAEGSPTYATTTEAEQAVAIAENSEWPAWDHGY